MSKREVVAAEAIARLRAMTLKRRNGKRIAAALQRLINGTRPPLPPEEMARREKRMQELELEAETDEAEVTAEAEAEAENWSWKPAPASDQDVYRVLAAIYKEAGTCGPNKAIAEQRVRIALRVRGLKASRHQIRRIADAPKFAKRRVPAGKRRPK